MRGEVEKKGDAQPRQSMMLKKSAPGPKKKINLSVYPGFSGDDGAGPSDSPPSSTRQLNWAELDTTLANGSTGTRELPQARRSGGEAWAAGVHVRAISRASIHR